MLLRKSQVLVFSTLTPGLALYHQKLSNLIFFPSYHLHQCPLCVRATDSDIWSLTFSPSRKFKENIQNSVNVWTQLTSVLKSQALQLWKSRFVTCSLAKLKRHLLGTYIISNWQQTAINCSVHVCLKHSAEFILILCREFWSNKEKTWPLSWKCFQPSCHPNCLLNEFEAKHKPYSGRIQLLLKTGKPSLNSC